MAGLAGRMSTVVKAKVSKLLDPLVRNAQADVFGHGMGQVPSDQSDGFSSARTNRVLARQVSQP